MTKEDHKKLGIQYFNKTWDYIDMKERSMEDNLDMIHHAHASLFHWKQSGAPMLNIVRGEWQISRVYSILNMGDSALLHATYCYDETLKNNFTDFDLVFAFEAMARAHLVLGNIEQMKEYLEKGYDLIDQVSKNGDKDYCRSELNSIKNNV